MTPTGPTPVPTASLKPAPEKSDTLRLVPDAAARVDLDSIFAEIDAAMERFAALDKEDAPASLAASAADLEAERSPIETPAKADTTGEHEAKVLSLRGERDV